MVWYIPVTLKYCFFFLHFLQQPYESLIIFVFTLVSLACSQCCQEPLQSPLCFLVVLKGGSVVACPTCTMNNYNLLPCGMCSFTSFSSALISAYVGMCCWPGHGFLCSVTWPLLLIITVGALQLWRCQTLVFLFKCACESDTSFFLKKKQITFYSTLLMWCQEAPGFFMQVDIF